MIKFNQEILQKAQDILEVQRVKREYYTTCIKAEICPHDGEALVLTGDSCDNTPRSKWQCSKEPSHIFDLLPRR